MAILTATGAGNDTTSAGNCLAGSALTTSGPSPRGTRMVGLDAAVGGGDGHGRRARAGHPAHRRWQVAVLPAAGAVALRQDRGPDGGDLAAGGPDCRPGGRIGVPRHRLVRHRQRAPVHAGAGQCAGAGEAGRRRYPDHLTGATAERVPAAGPGPAGDWILGVGRGPLPLPLPLQVGPRLPARLPLRGTLHPREGGRRSGVAGPVPDCHCQARREGQTHRLFQRRAGH